MSTSEAPDLTHTTIKELVAHSITVILKAQAAMMESTNNPNSEPRKTSVARKCDYEKFASYQLFYFNGTDGAVGLIRWFKQTESIFSRSKCAEENKVRFAVSTLTKEALSWLQFEPLMQREKVIAYASRQLKIHEKNYMTHDLELEAVGDKVMLKVSPWKGVIHFGKRGKLNPRYVGPFKVLEKVGSIAYKLELPQELSRVHNTFHVSNLKKFYADEPLAVPFDGLHFDDKIQFVKEPVEIMDREVKRLKRSRIPIIKVRWNSRRGPEFTWEREDQFRKKYPHLFTKTAPSSSAAS
ncbi:hypothetical protein Tco_0567557 [Tanacetum coccineum]